MRYLHNFQGMKHEIYIFRPKKGKKKIILLCKKKERKKSFYYVFFGRPITLPPYSPPRTRPHRKMIIYKMGDRSFLNPHKQSEKIPILRQTSELGFIKNFENTKISFTSHNSFFAIYHLFLKYKFSLTRMRHFLRY